MNERSNSELIAETRRLSEAATKEPWTVEKTTNNYGTDLAEEVWDITYHDFTGDSSEHVAECGAVWCSGTKETAYLIARYRTLAPLLAQRLLDAEREKGELETEITRLRAENDKLRSQQK